MHELNLLSKLLQSNWIESPTLFSGNYRATLKESCAGSSFKKIFITGLNESDVILKPDNSDFIKYLFKSVGDIRKRCDYIVLTEYNGRKYSVLIELKSSLPKRKKYMGQLKGGEYFLACIEMSLNIFYAGKNFLSQYEKRYALLYKKNIRKRTTRLSKSSSSIANIDLDSTLKFPVGKLTSINIKHLIP